MIPELGLDLGYQVNCHWRAHLGYNILYWGCVSRAADQISLYVDPRNIPSNHVTPTAVCRSRSSPTRRPVSGRKG